MRCHNNEIWLLIKLFCDSITPFIPRNPFFLHDNVYFDASRFRSSQIYFASGLATIHKTIPAIPLCAIDFVDRGSRAARNIAPRSQLRIYDGETSRDPVGRSRIRRLLRCKDYRVNWDACSLVRVHIHTRTPMKDYLLAESEKGED